MVKETLWTRNYTLLIVSSALGAAGGIMGGFALSFLVFDETGSTLAGALIVAIQLIPYFIVPIIAAPWMDRLPRKPFLVAGDAVGGVLYALCGLYLMKYEFSYAGYLGFSLVLACIGSFDELAYSSIYPKLIPGGMEQKGYAVSSTLYPVLKVIMMPLAAVALDALGVALLLIIQGGASLLAAAAESRISIKEERRMDGGRFGFSMWREDIREAVRYLKKEKGLQNIYAYMSVTNGVAGGYSSLLVAFFRTMPGFTAAMYSFFSVAEFLGRTIGGAVQYKVRTPNDKKFAFTFLVYQVYEAMDMCLLWLPYPLMLLNRAICGFLGVSSATLRQAAVQSYIPEKLRARINAFEGMVVTAACSLLSLAVGALGEVLDYRLCLTACGALSMALCWITVWRGRADVRRIYEARRSPVGDNS